MWWQQLPSFGITTAVFVLPLVIDAGLRFLSYEDKWIRRSTGHHLDKTLIYRDEFITGSRYRTTGIDWIPTEKE